MIIGVGTDLCDSRRIARSVERFGKRFLNRVYTPAEQAAAKGDPLKLAKRFAAKEAVSKALGTGVRGFNLEDIEILNDDLGAPKVFLRKGALKILAERAGEGAKVHVSLSDEAPYALAFAVICRQT